MYYSLYAVLMKIGVKCEIHACSLEIMKKLLVKFYSEEDFRLIKKAFDLRSISQYYVDKIIDQEESNFAISHAIDFLSKSKQVLSSMNQDDINEIRKKLK